MQQEEDNGACISWLRYLKFLLSQWCCCTKPPYTEVQRITLNFAGVRRCAWYFRFQPIGCLHERHVLSFRTLCTDNPAHSSREGTLFVSPIPRSCFDATYSNQLDRNLASSIQSSLVHSILRCIILPKPRNKSANPFINRSIWIVTQ